MQVEPDQRLKFHDNHDFGNDDDRIVVLTLQANVTYSLAYTASLCTLIYVLSLPLSSLLLLTVTEANGPLTELR